MASLEDGSTFLLPPKRSSVSCEQCVICQTNMGHSLQKAILETLAGALEMQDDDVFKRLKTNIVHLSICLSVGTIDVTELTQV